HLRILLASSIPFSLRAGRAPVWACQPSVALLALTAAELKLPPLLERVRLLQSICRLNLQLETLDQSSERLAKLLSHSHPVSTGCVWVSLSQKSKRYHGLVPWYFMFAATYRSKKTHGCHGLAPWNFTFLS